MRRMNLRLGLVVGACATEAWAQASFEGLGVLPGAEESYAVSVSPDGLCASGSSGSAVMPGRAFRWFAGAMQDLGIAPGALSCEGGPLNTGGTVMAGVAVAFNQRPYRWTQATGLMQDLGFPAGSNHLAAGISADGSVISGSGGSSPIQPRIFRWMAGAGWQYLALPAGFTASAGGAMNAGGSVIVGAVFSSPNPPRAAVWTNGVPAVLPLIPGHTEGAATAVSADGLVVTGVSGPSPTERQMFRWTQATGMQNLGGQNARGNGISADGSVIVGTADFGGADHATLWTEATGLVSLNEYLPSLGINLTGWMLEYAVGVSADGRTIVGQGWHDGHGEGWIARLPGVCYPDCTGNGALTVGDFGCFQTRFAAGDPYADCDGSGGLAVADFGCFQTRFVAGCP